MRAVRTMQRAGGLGQVERLRGARLETAGWRSMLPCRVPRDAAGAWQRRAHLRRKECPRAEEEVPHALK